MTDTELIAWFRQCVKEVASNECSRGPGCDICMGQVWGDDESVERLQRIAEMLGVGAIINGMNPHHTVVVEQGKQIDIPDGCRAIVQPNGNVGLYLQTAAGPWIAVQSGERPHEGEEVLMICGNTGEFLVAQYEAGSWYWDNTRGQSAFLNVSHWARINPPEER